MFAFSAKHNSLFFFVLFSLRRNLPSIRAERSKYYALDGDGVSDRRDELLPHLCVRTILSNLRSKSSQFRLIYVGIKRIQK